ncbi:MAG: hypothetical protein MMC23_008357 [Stictis urceolatum]|nr:hypothetical protein [Stictis urceolata]
MPLSGSIGKDSSYTYIHLPSSRHADLFEEFTRPPLPHEEIFIPPSRLPPNPEDEDDVVPDQHAAFGIQRATQARREPAWRDLGMGEIVSGEGLAGLSLGEGRVSGSAAGVGVMVGAGAGTGQRGIGMAGAGGVRGAEAGMGRGAGIGMGVGGMGLGRGEVRSRGGVADVGARMGAVAAQERRAGMLPR